MLEYQSPPSPRPYLNMQISTNRWVTVLQSKLVRGRFLVRVPLWAKDGRCCCSRWGCQDSIRVSACEPTREKQTRKKIYKYVQLLVRHGPSLVLKTRWIPPASPVSADPSVRHNRSCWCLTNILCHEMYPYYKAIHLNIINTRTEKYSLIVYVMGIKMNNIIYLHSL